MSSRVNGLPFTREQLNQVALMGPIHLPKQRSSHPLDGWTHERGGERETESEGATLTEKQMWTPESDGGICKSNKEISSVEV